MSDDYRRSIREALKAFQATLKELSAELRSSELAHGQAAVRSEYLEERVKEALGGISNLKDRMIRQETAHRNFDGLQKKVDDLDRKVIKVEADLVAVGKIEDRVKALEDSPSNVSDLVARVVAIESQAKGSEKTWATFFSIVSFIGMIVAIVISILK